MNLAKIPATVVTGFLGSGKTTLLANLLKQANGKRIAVIVNEFGELDIDADLLRGCPLACDDDTTTTANNGIYELANGCICCTVEEEFYPVMQELVARRDSIDHILIETSGLALPKPLVQAFNWPDIKRHCTVDAVITVVDGPATAQGRFAHDLEQLAEQRLADENLDHDPSVIELFEDQLSAADMILVSKNDLLSDAQRNAVQQTIHQHVSSTVKTLNMQHGEVDAALILGINAASETTIDQTHTHHDHHHQQGQAHHHVHEDFDSMVVRLSDVDSPKLLALLQQLIAENVIYRVKGVVAVAGKPMRQVIQGVGSRFDHYFDRAWRVDEPRCSRIVLIGKDLQPEKIEHVLSQASVV